MSQLKLWADLGCEEDRPRDVLLPGGEDVREVHDEALVREDEDVVRATGAVEVGELAEELQEVLVRSRVTAVRNENEQQIAEDGADRFWR